MQHSDSSIHTIISAVRPSAYHSSEPSIVTLPVRNLLPPPSQYQPSYSLPSNSLFAVEQQHDSHHPPLTHMHHHLAYAAPPLSMPLGRYIAPEIIPDTAYGSTASSRLNAVSQSAETSPAPYLCDLKPYKPNGTYANLFVQSHPIEHRAFQWPDDTRSHEPAYGCVNTDNQRLPGSAEKVRYEDMCVDDSRNEGEIGAELSDSHMGSLFGESSIYTAPQLTSPANQRAANARRKREAKYTCDMCGSRLTARHNLASHMNAHFGIKPFRCHFCKREYTAKSTFRRHMKTVHRK